MADFLQIEHVSKVFGGLRAVDDISFTLERGSLTALIGPNGAGKTTMFNMVAGAMTPTTGSSRFQGTRIRNPRAASELGIGRTFQNIRLFREMTVLENVMIGMDRPGFLAASLRLPPLVAAERSKMKRSYALLEDVGLEHSIDARAGDIPFGQQRLLEIARALAIGPQLLLLDEPAAGLNRTESQGLAEIIRRIRESGITILLIEHDMPLVMSLAERILVLDGGKLIADDTPAEVRANPRVCEAYLGVPTC